MVQHLLGSRRELVPSSALFDPIGTVAVVMLDALSGVERDQVTVVGEPHSGDGPPFDPWLEAGAVVHPDRRPRSSRMATTKQKTAARKNIKKAASAAKKKQTITKLPKSTRTALGKQANKVKKQKSSRSR